MNNMENKIYDFQLNLLLTITNNINKNTPLQHNHKPLFGIVKNCNYCKYKGNIFQNGCIKENEVQLNFLLPKS